MRPESLDVIGSELAIKWSDGTESFISLETLRRACPCAACKGETDVMGNVYKGPEQQLSPDAFRVRSMNFVGGYAIQPQWADGHGSGLFTFEHLRRLAQS